eukprot:gene550-2463_t
MAGPSGACDWCPMQCHGRRKGKTNEDWEATKRNTQTLPVRRAYPDACCVATSPLVTAHRTTQPLPPLDLPAVLIPPPGETPSAAVAKDVRVRYDHLVLYVPGIGSIPLTPGCNPRALAYRAAPIRKGFPTAGLSPPGLRPSQPLVLAWRAPCCPSGNRTGGQGYEDPQRKVGAFLEMLNQTAPKDKAHVRIAFKTVEWASHVFSLADEDGMSVEAALDAITPEGMQSCQGVRKGVKTVSIEVMLWMGKYGSQIAHTVCDQLNQHYRDFIRRYPNKNLKVSLLAHSLGGVISYEILVNQRPRYSELCAQFTIPSMSFSHMPFQSVPSLCFPVANFFCLGSPVGLFLVARGCRPPDPLSIHGQVWILPQLVAVGSALSLVLLIPVIANNAQDACLPACLSAVVLVTTSLPFYNVYDPVDPVSHRLDPFLGSHLPPVLVDHHPEALPWVRSILHTLFWPVISHRLKHHLIKHQHLPSHTVSAPPLPDDPTCAESPVASQHNASGSSDPAYPSADSGTVK